MSRSYVLMDISIYRDHWRLLTPFQWRWTATSSRRPSTPKNDDKSEKERKRKTEDSKNTNMFHSYRKNENSLPCYSNKYKPSSKITQRIQNILELHVLNLTFNSKKNSRYHFSRFRVLTFNFLSSKKNFRHCVVFMNCELSVQHGNIDYNDYSLNLN